MISLNTKRPTQFCVGSLFFENNTATNATVRNNNYICVAVLSRRINGKNVKSHFLKMTLYLLPILHPRYPLAPDTGSTPSHGR